MNLAEQLEDLDSIESFFTLFNVEYDERFITNSRIQLLKLFHQKLSEYQTPVEYYQYQEALTKAYCLLQRGVSIPLAASACHSCKSECSTESI